MLDAGSLQYSYSILAAAAVFHIYSQDAALSVSGMCAVNSHCLYSLCYYSSRPQFAADVSALTLFVGREGRASGL